MSFEENTKTFHEEAVNKVIDYIDSNLSSMPSIKEIASIANISGFHFHRIFKTIVGETIGEFIIRKRLEEVAFKLFSTKESLADIAFEVGYANKSVLSRAFKEYFGVTPSEYRRNKKKSYDYWGSREYRDLNLIPRIVTIKSKKIVYTRIIDIYGADNSYQTAWLKLMNFAKEKNLLNKDTEFLGLSFDDPALVPPEKCRFYACLSIREDIKPEGIFGIRFIKGGKYAVFLHKGPYSDLKETYYNIYFLWFNRVQPQIRGTMSFEKFLNTLHDTLLEDLQTEIYVPIF